MFSPQTYVERRKRLRDQISSGIVILLGNEESAMNYVANTYDFRQDSSFLYFFGLDSPHLAGGIDLDEGREIIFGDELTLDDILWTGPLPTVAERAEEVGVGETAPFAQLKAFVRDAVKAGREVHFLPPYRADQTALLAELLGRDTATIRDGASLSLIRAVVAQRSIKTAEEVEEIEKGVAICREMQVTAMRMTEPGVIEQEVAGVLEGITRMRGGRFSFPIIFSVHGETMHNHYHGNEMKEGELVLNDSGAESPLHYAGDITRTFPVSGHFSDRQKDIYTVVLAAQLVAIEAAKPGVEYRAVHGLAAKTIAKGLSAVGLMKGDPDAAVEAGAHALFFPTGLGHMLGLDVHDMEGLGEEHVGYTDEIQRNPIFGWRNLRLARALEPGFVLTVEPGVYFIPELIAKWKAEGRHAEFIDYAAVEKYIGFGGIRIEDDILITEKGSRVLGPPIPKTIKEIEALTSS
jgi:Xaa-Pro aminopeptidase